MVNQESADSSQITLDLNDSHHYTPGNRSEFNKLLRLRSVSEPELVERMFLDLLLSMYSAEFQIFYRGDVS